MQNTSLSDIINKSMQRTGLILFKPFVLKKWLFLLMIAYLSGNLGGGCGNGGGSRTCNRLQRKAEATPSHIVQYDSTKDDPSSVAHAANKVPAENHSQADHNPFRDWQAWPRWAHALIIFAIFLVLAIMILLTWISSRFQFVWVHAIINNDASIVKPFGDYRQQGDSLFKLNLAILFISLLYIAGIVTWIIFPLSAQHVFQNPENLPIWGYVKIVGPPLMILILLLVVTAVFMHLVIHFVVPIMAADRILFMDGWKKFCEIYQKNTKDVWIYLLTRLGLGIAASVIISIAVFIVLIIFLLCGALIAGLLYLIFALLFKLKVVSIILMILVGIPLAAGLIVLITLLGLPVAVFFRNFSLYYLSGLDCPYQPLSLAEQ